MPRSVGEMEEEDNAHRGPPCHAMPCHGGSARCSEPKKPPESVSSGTGRTKLGELTGWTRVHDVGLANETETPGQVPNETPTPV